MSLIEWLIEVNESFDEKRVSHKLSPLLSPQCLSCCIVEPLREAIREIIIISLTLCA